MRESEAAELAGLDLDVQFVAGATHLGVRHFQALRKRPGLLAGEPTLAGLFLDLVLDLFLIHACIVADDIPHPPT